MVGHRIECRARAAGVGLLGGHIFRPIPSIAWVAFRGDMTDATVPPHEIGERKENIPR